MKLRSQSRAPAATPENGCLCSRIDEVGQRLDELTRISGERERVIDELHRENQALRAGELMQATTPLLRGLMRLYDKLQEGAQAHLAGANVNDLLEGFRDSVGDLLYNHGIDRFDPVPGEQFNPRQHRGVSPVPVQDPALDRTVARCLRPGFQRDGRILREADVEVCRFVTAPNTEITEGGTND